MIIVFELCFFNKCIVYYCEIIETYKMKPYGMVKYQLSLLCRVMPKPLCSFNRTCVHRETL